MNKEETMLIEQLPDSLVKKLDAYRKQRKQETGKHIMRTTAIAELLVKALDGIEPASPICDRLAELESRVTALENGKEWTC
jgi:hypothetical protein